MLQAKGLDVRVQEFAVGTVATIDKVIEPDGNTCNPKETTDPFFKQPQTTCSFGKTLLVGQHSRV